ncbi:hypothetical protein GN956_G11175 [Arapaima gigas]
MQVSVSLLLPDKVIKSEAVHLCGQPSAMCGIQIRAGDTSGHQTQTGEGSALPHFSSSFAFSPPAAYLSAQVAAVSQPPIVSQSEADENSR